MRHALLVALLWLFPAMAPAQTIAVRSGEHPGFSRLVFEMPGERAWRLGRSKDGYLLDLADPGLKIDLSRVFEKIGRTRLSAVSPGAPGQVHLAVGAQAHLHAFDLRPGVLVVDIRDGPPPPDSPFETPIDGAAKVAAPQLPIQAGRLAPDPRVAPLLAPRPEDHDPAGLRQALFEQVGRAASQGLIGPVAPGAGGAPVRSGSKKAETADPPASGTALQASNLQVETSIDRGLALAVGGGAATDPGEACWPDAMVDVSAWYGDGPAAALIARRRSALFDGRDRVVPGAPEELAKAYLALGFGAEAARVLQQFAPESPQVAVWQQMAAILDEGQAADPSVFDGQLDCPGMVALWAALARPALPAGSTSDTAAIRRGFAALVPHLRRRLAPPLAERFLDRGDMNTAMAIRNAALRVEGRTTGAELGLMSARIAADRGEMPEAQDLLAPLARGGSPAASEALALKLQIDLSADSAPTYDDLLAAEALAFEARGTSQGDRLRRLAIEGHARRGAFATAFAMFAEFPTAQTAPLSTKLIEILAETGSDADILGVVAGGRVDPVLSGAGAAARLRLARRLVRLGFAQRAGESLVGLHGLDGPEARQVLAEIAVARGAPGQALQYLAGLDTPEAMALRAQARAARGDLPGATEAAEAAGLIARAAEYAWRARDWSAIRRHGTAAQKRVAELRPAAGAPGPGLAGARRALSHSGELRIALTAVLEPDAESVRPVRKGARLQVSSTPTP